MALLDRYSEREMRQTRTRVLVLPSTTENRENLELVIVKKRDGELPVHATLRLSKDETRRVFRVIDSDPKGDDLCSA